MDTIPVTSVINKSRYWQVQKLTKMESMQVYDIQVINAIINSKIRTELDSTGNLSMKVSDTHVNCVIKNERKA